MKVNSNKHLRNYKGYLQILEDFEVQDKNGNFKNIKRWVFYVTGFDKESNYCYVLKFNGTKNRIFIDNHDCILIDGRKYTRKFWNH